MKIADLMKCAKPLIFENKDEEFTYSFAGTCFLASFESRHYAITARHCIQSHNYKSARIRLEPGNLTFLQMVGVYYPNGKDYDLYDLAAYEIDSRGIPSAEVVRAHFLDLDYYSKMPVDFLTSDSILALRGCPSEINQVDYEDNVIRTKEFATDGFYDGPAEEKGCSRIRFINLESIESLDGLSGSPVFNLNEIEEKQYSHFFAGVFIRGTKGSLLGRFINAEVVYAFLNLVGRQKRASASL
jgi:hypothetical protein